MGSHKLINFGQANSLDKDTTYTHTQSNIAQLCTSYYYCIDVTMQKNITITSHCLNFDLIYDLHIILRPVRITVLPWPGRHTYKHTHTHIQTHIQTHTHTHTHTYTHIHTYINQD